MNVETLIFAYLAICASMIAFNCACIFVFRARSTARREQGSHLEERVEEQMARLRAGEPVEESHLAFLRRKLSRTGHLMAFDETLDRMLARDPETLWDYLRAIKPVFIYLAMENRYRTPMKLTYFAYVAKKYRVLEGTSVGPLFDLMMRLLREPSLYCRENAMEAVCSSGDCGSVLRALREIDESGRFHHAKLLTDGLVAFPGDRDQLAGLLWQNFDRFSVHMQVVILDYIRFSGREMGEELLQLLADSRQDDEIRFSCIRYFGRYPSEQALPLLIAFVESPGENRWEYAAVSASALAAYPCPRSVQVLKKALSSSNWYIRFNAAGSLERFHLSYLELSDVLDGGDRYAREIMQYRMDLENAGKTRREALV